MEENVGQLEISVHYLIFNQSFEGIQYLDEEFDSFGFIEFFSVLQVLTEIALVTVFQHQVKVIGGFFDIVELDYILVVACSQDSDLIF